MKIFNPIHFNKYFTITIHSKFFKKHCNIKNTKFRFINHQSNKNGGSHGNNNNGINSIKKIVSDGDNDKSKHSWLSAIWTLYEKELLNRPIFTKIWTSGIITAIGDITAQFYIETEKSFDLKRFLVFTFLGLFLVAPALHHWYHCLASIFTSMNWKSTLSSLLCDQFLFAPVFTGVFMASLLTLEGHPENVNAKLKQDWFNTLVVNWKIWIPAQIINFSIVPPQLRVLFANCVALIWNVYLSYAAHIEIGKNKKQLL